MLQTTEFWSQVRFLLLYPMIASFGTAWGVAFWLRYRRTRCLGDRAASALGTAMAIWALMGILGLWLSRIFGFGAATSLTFTLGAAASAVVLMVGVGRIFLAGWRKNDGPE